MSPQDPQSGWGPPPSGQGGPPPRRRSAGKIIGLSCFALIALAIVLIIAVLAVGGGDDGPDPTPTSPAPTQATTSGPRGDVRITACEVDSTTRWPSAELVITNRSSKASDYVVHVEFVDASGRRLSEAVASSSNVAPGQQSRVTAQSLNQVATEVSCRVTDVTRFAS